MLIKMAKICQEKDKANHSVDGLNQEKINLFLSVLDDESELWSDFKW